MTRPVGAVSGSKCGHSTTRRSGRASSVILLAAWRYAAASAAPDASVVNIAARARPRRIRSSRRAATVPSASAPAVRIQRQDERRISRHLGERGLVAGDDGCAERHRLEDGSAEALVLAREHERLGERDESVAIGGRDRDQGGSLGRRRRARRSPARPRRRRHLVLRGARARGRRPSSASAISPTRKRWPLCGWVIAGKDEHAAVADAVPDAEVAGVGQRRRVRSIDPVRDDHDLGRGRPRTRSVDRVRTYSLGTAITSALRADDGMRRRRYVRRAVEKYSGNRRYCRSWIVSTAAGATSPAGPASARASSPRRGGRCRRRRASTAASGPRRGCGHCAGAASPRVR